MAPYMISTTKNRFSSNNIDISSLIITKILRIWIKKFCESLLSLRVWPHPKSMRVKRCQRLDRTKGSANSRPSRCLKRKKLKLKFRLERKNTFRLSSTKMRSSERWEGLSITKMRRRNERGDVKNRFQFHHF